MNRKLNSMNLPSRIIRCCRLYRLLGYAVPAIAVLTFLPTGRAPLANDHLSTSKARESAVIIRSSESGVVEYPWGRLTWFASAKLGNSSTMTIGQAMFRPEQGIPTHLHPNGEEIVHVLKGRVLVLVEGRPVTLEEGDTITIPAGIAHSGKNIGVGEALMSVSFSSADRQIIWKENVKDRPKEW